MICSPGSIFDRVAREECVERLPIPMRREIAPISDLVSFFRLWSALRILKPDLVEFSTPKAGLLGTAAALFCRVPARIYMLRGLRAETTCGMHRRLLIWAERLAAACSHLVLCNSPSLRDRALAMQIAPPAKMRILGRGSSNGIDARRYAPGPNRVRARLGIPRNVPVIGFVGRLTRDKGVPELVAAFERVLDTIPDARLLLVGRFDNSVDAVTPELRARIQAHPQIIHTGFVHNTAPFYRAMDLFVLPTYREGFPNVVLEASATGVPVITTRVTGARDSIHDGRTGVLIPAGDPAAITSEIVRLLENSELRAAMGAAGRRWVMENFRQERVLGQTLALYRGMLDQAAAPSTLAFIRDVAAPAD
jgi:glycosyltransferase involved in cell wall biosynthesis